MEVMHWWNTQKEVHTFSSITLTLTYCNLMKVMEYFVQARDEVENEARFNAMLSVEATIRKRKRDDGSDVRTLAPACLLSLTSMFSPLSSALP